MQAASDLPVKLRRLPQLPLQLPVQALQPPAQLLSDSRYPRLLIQPLPFLSGRKSGGNPYHLRMERI